MNPDLLNYYQQELESLQKNGADFAKRYPKLAGHLQTQNLAQADPHLARLVESVAFMNAQVRHKLDDEFSILSDGLFDILQPAYHQPLPAMVIAQFKPQPDLTQAAIIARHTPVETLSTQSEPLRFKTCYETTLLPVEVSDAELLPHCETAPALSQKQANGCLHLVLRCLDTEQSFAQLAPQALRFFLAGNSTTSFAVYDLLMRHTVALAISSTAGGKSATFLNHNQLQAVGFAADETIVPYNARQPLAYQLLTEYFAYPDKFLFIELNQFSQTQWQQIGHELHLYFYLRRVSTISSLAVNASMFALGCTPLVNLYPKLAEPLTITGQSDEYTVTPDIRQPQHHEIYTIEQVTAINQAGQITRYLPLFSLGQHGCDQDAGYWQARRCSRFAKSEMTIRLTDLRGQVLLEDSQVLQIATTCFNPAVQELWQQDEAQPKLQLTLGSAPVTLIQSLTQPSRIIRPQLAKGTRWRLVSSMALGHLTLAQDNAAALQEVLQLYDVIHSDQTQSLVQSIQALRSSVITLRLPIAGQLSFCQGLEMTLVVDGRQFAGSSAWLFAHLLAHFLALQASINSFVQLQVIDKDSQQALYCGQPLLGQQALL
jgi:type VI secretion system protein ImpG